MNENQPESLDGHKAGPWHLLSSAFIEPCKGSYWEICQDGAAIAFVLADQWSPEIDMANARLISKAPDIFECLKQCVRTMEQDKASNLAASPACQNAKKLLGL